MSQHMNRPVTQSQTKLVYTTTLGNTLILSVAGEKGQVSQHMNKTSHAEPNQTSVHHNPG